MEFNNKHYKLKKTKTFFQKESFFLIYTSNNLNSKNCLKLKQTLQKNNLQSTNISNKLAKNFIENSIFKKFSIMLTGSLCLVKMKNHNKINKTIKELLVLDNSITLIGLKFNKKIYSTNQITNFQLLNYSQNMVTLTKSLNKLVKLPHYKLKKNKSK